MKEQDTDDYYCPRKPGSQSILTTQAVGNPRKVRHRRHGVTNRLLNWHPYLSPRCNNGGTGRAEPAGDVRHASFPSVCPFLVGGSAALFTRVPTPEWKSCYEASLLLASASWRQSTRWSDTNSLRQLMRGR